MEVNVSRCRTIRPEGQIERVYRGAFELHVARGGDFRYSSNTIAPACPTPEHTYASRDWRVVDYGCVTLNGSERLVRGPLPPSLEPRTYFACMGAAQTFGCFCEHPFPNLVSQRLGLPVLNLGFGGAGPEYFLRRPALIEYCNRARFVVLQALSGRSVSNSLFESEGDELLTRRGDGFTTGADAAYQELMKETAWLTIPAGGKRRLYLVPPRPTHLQRIIAETRQNWLSSFKQLLRSLTAPVIWFWFSKRKPRYRERYWTVNHLFGEFPQLVNQPMVSAIQELAANYVECVSRRGSPQPLFDRFTGERARLSMATENRSDLAEIWKSNRYYPSPEMHEDAAILLEPAGRRFL